MTWPSAATRRSSRRRPISMASRLTLPPTCGCPRPSWPRRMPGSSRGCWPGSGRRSPTAACSTRPSWPRRPGTGRAKSGPDSMLANSSGRSPVRACSCPAARPRIRRCSARSGRRPSWRGYPGSWWSSRPRPGRREGGPGNAGGGPRAGHPRGLPGERAGRDRRAHVRHGHHPARSQDRRAGQPAGHRRAGARPALRVATQMLCGPSESLLIADETADPWRLAIDLLNEAEHGIDSAATLITTSEALVAAVETALAEQLPLLPPIRAAAARAVLSDLGGAILVDSMAEAVEVANDYAAEHVQLATSRSRGDPRVAALRRRGAPRPGHADRRLELHDRDPGDAADRRLRPAQRRGDGADVPDLDLDGTPVTRSPGRARRADPGPGRPRGLPGPRQRLPPARPGLAFGHASGSSTAVWSIGASRATICAICSSRVAATRSQPGDSSRATLQAG